MIENHAGIWTRCTTLIGMFSGGCPQTASEGCALWTPYEEGPSRKLRPRVILERSEEYVTGGGFQTTSADVVLGRMHGPADGAYAKTSASRAPTPRP